MAGRARPARLEPEPGQGDAPAHSPKGSLSQGWGSHPQNPSGTETSPAAPRSAAESSGAGGGGLSWVPTLPQVCGTALALEMWGAQGCCPPGEHTCPGVPAASWVLSAPLVVSFVTMLLQTYYSSSGRPAPATPGSSRVPAPFGGLWLQQSPPVLRGTSSHNPSSSDIPLPRGLHLPPPALHRNPHHFPPSFKFLN